MIGPTNLKTLLTAALLTSLLGVTGCGQRMLKNYSSLAPKTASVERLDFTFRSQNALPQNQPPGSTAWAGHSGFPKARLLQPQFGEVSGDISSESPEANPASSQTVAPSGGHSLGFTANQIRQRMNERNQSASTVELLPEKKEVWQVLSASNTTDPIAADRSLPTNTQPHVASPDIAHNKPAADGVFSTDASFSATTDATTVSETSPVVERSVLDRLKGLYDDSETNAKQLFRRNLQRLPNPWNVFREKDEQNSAEPIDSVLPPFETEPAEEETFSQPGQDDSAAIALITIVEAELNNWPRTLSGKPQNPEVYQRRQQDLRLLQLIAGRPEEAIASIEGMPGPEQEFWQELMLGLAHFRS